MLKISNMPDTTISPEEKIIAPMGQQPVRARPVSWKTFEKKYLPREDRYKYEWVNGLVEKTERDMNQYQTVIAARLLKLFFQLISKKKATGILAIETDTFFLPKVHRRPDICWFSDQQLSRMAAGENQVPRFVIEIISKNDQIYQVNKKLRNYHDAGVEVVWLLFPLLEEVQVVHGNKITKHTGAQTISAAPVLPAFSLTVKEVFQKPVPEK
ncbi:MAG TPA: Uma2 family endonuclease [Bacteroidetes bacterium]|nr:Uma2 family endonuclease [Bacteroidota bacterium]